MHTKNGHLMPIDVVVTFAVGSMSHWPCFCWHRLNHYNCFSYAAFIMKAGGSSFHDQLSHRSLRHVRSCKCRWLTWIEDVDLSDNKQGPCSSTFNEARFLAWLKGEETPSRRIRTKSDNKKATRRAYANDGLQGDRKSFHLLQVSGKNDARKASITWHD